MIYGPATVIVAGVYSTVLAFTSSDGLVADDYYKQGLAINKTLKREERARALDMNAVLSFDIASGRVKVILAGAERPPVILLRLTHPTRAGMDRQVELALAGDDIYSGAISGAQLAGRWNVVLETGQWRLAGVWNEPLRATLALAPAAL